MYWLAMEKIPKSIFNKIRRRMFSFLWSGNKETKSFHLVRWDTLAKPKKCGGWGFKNMFNFGKALVAKFLWRIMFGNGMCHEVIIKKYLKRVSLNGWLRKGNSNVKGMSNCWKSLYGSLSIVTDC